MNMLLQLKDQAEILLVISAPDIAKNKVRGDLGITYDADVLRLIDAFRGIGLYVGSVVLTQFEGQPAAEAFQKRLESLGVKVFRHYTIPGYPSNIPLIVSDQGFGKNDYVETSRSLVVVTAPDREAAKWPPASPSCTMRTSGASRQGTPNSRPSPFGTCPWPIR